MKPIKSNTINRPGDSGFSLVEILMGLAVAAVLLSTAVPTFSSVVHKNRVSAASTQLYVSLNTARSEALKRRSAVTVCPINSDHSCRDDGDWSEGWLIYQDENGNNSPQADEMIQVIEDLDGEIDMQVSTALSEFIEFQATGAVTGNAGNSGELRLCHLDSITDSMVITVSAAGSVVSESRDQSDCNGS